MKGIAHETITRLFECPQCHKPAFSVSHLPIGTAFGPWYCDNCGWASRGMVTIEGCNLELTTERHIKTYVLLQREDLFLVVSGLRFEKDGKSLVDDDEDSARYFYEEHTCPTNFIGGDVVAVIEGGDRDPHGCFRFVAVIDQDKTGTVKQDVNGDIEWADVFRQLT